MKKVNLFTIGTCSAVLRQPTLQPKRRQRRTTKSWKKKKRNDVIFGLCFPLNCIQPLTTARRDMPEREKGGENINKKGGMWYASTGRFLRSLSCRTNGPRQFIPGPNRSATLRSTLSTRHRPQFSSLFFRPAARPIAKVSCAFTISTSRNLPPTGQMMIAASGRTNESYAIV